MSPADSAPKAAAEESVLVEKLVPGGHGFARLEAGESVLVPGALPGDFVCIQRLERRAGVKRATEWSLLEPSLDRVEPVCEVAAECGGCDLMALAPEAQERAKLGLFRDALRRVAELDAALCPTRLTSAGPALSYRSRLRLQIDERGRIGFFRKQSRTMIQPTRCHVADPAIETALGALRKLARQRPRALAAFSSVEVRVSEAGVSLYFALAPGHAYLPVDSQSLLGSLKRDFIVASSHEAPEPSRERFMLDEGLFMHAAPGSFTQVNWAVNRVLVARVLERALAAQAADFVDLYCGSGNFSLPLMKAGLRGVGVESSPAAIAAAKLAASRQGLSGRFVVDSAVRWAEARLREGRLFDLVLVDPPRAGVRQGLESMAELARSEMALIGCDPVTFARDLRILLDCGFRLGHLEAFDMFPQTHHLEALAWLSRAP